MRFLSNFGSKIIFMCSVNFGISKIPTHCLKEALVTRRLSARGLLDKLGISSMTDLCLKTFDFTSLYTNSSYCDTTQAIITHCNLLNLPNFIGTVCLTSIILLTSITFLGLVIAPTSKLKGLLWAVTIAGKLQTLCSY